MKQQAFDGAYYICGEDDFQKEDAMRRLVGAAVDPAVRDFNLDVRRALEVDAKTLDALLSSMPVMAERRVLVIRDAGGLRKDTRKIVEQYLEKPSSDMLFLLVEATGGKTDKDLARLATVLDFDLLTADRIPRWISHHVTTQLKTGISAGAIDLLHVAVGNDLQQIVTELEKVASFANGREITEDIVSEVVGVRRGETMADLLDAIGRRDLKRALELLDHVLAQPKTSAVLIVMALATQTVALAWGRAKLDEGLPPGRLQSEYFDLLKQLGSVYTGRPWGMATTAWASAADSWDRESLQRALDALLTADLTLKETRLSSEEQVLTMLILTMCAGNEQKIAA
ncbi:MAG TPA: DNA polymerase III subunit delta [Rhodothermia bacterium]|nr:DNA polymerase III subunit delta [Rhodothermia bacterium]